MTRQRKQNGGELFRILCVMDIILYRIRCSILSQCGDLSVGILPNSSPFTRYWHRNILDLDLYF